MHIVFVMANNSSVPYFNWFAEASAKERAYTFSFICLFPTRPKMIEDMAQYECECHWIPYDDKHRKRDMLKAIFPLFKLFKKIKPDVVHTHLFDDSVPSLFAARLAGIKQRVITKGDAGYHFHYAPQWMVFDKFNNWNATHIVAISRENEKFIQDVEKPKAGKVNLIHHGIPVSQFTRQTEEDKTLLREKYKLDGRMVIGTVSRLIEWKGYKYIIDAAEKIVQEIPETTFLFVGIGPQEEELKEIVKQKKLDKHIIFTGWVDRQLIPSLYGIMDYYVHAASVEPFGFVIAEAMMNGLPIVTTPTGAARDIVEHGKNGILIPEKNGEAIYQAIIQLTQQNIKHLKENAKESALRLYDFDVMWQKHIHLYNNSEHRDN